MQLVQITFRSSSQVKQCRLGYVCNQTKTTSLSTSQHSIKPQRLTLTLTLKSNPHPGVRGS